MSIKGWAGAAALALTGMMVTTAFAQPPEGGGRRGGAMFGGGMRPTSTIQLAAIPAVQKELAVTEEQTEKLKTLAGEAMAEMRSAGGGPGGGGGGNPPSEADRAAQAAKRAEIVEKYKPKLAEILNAGQVERLGQIALQAAGPQALSDAAVAKKLSLTKDQQEKIASINKEFDAKRRELFQGGGGGDREAAMAKMQELGKTHEKDLTSVLTTDQQTQLASLKGKEFDLAQLRGPGGPGGPGGGGRRRPPE